MKNLQFNHSIEGDISILVDGEKVGSIINTDTVIVEAEIKYEGDNQTALYPSVDIARRNIKEYFSHLDVYEF